MGALFLHCLLKLSSLSRSDSSPCHSPLSTPQKIYSKCLNGQQNLPLYRNHISMVFSDSSKELPIKTAFTKALGMYGFRSTIKLKP